MAAADGRLRVVAGRICHCIRDFDKHRDITTQISSFVVTNECDTTCNLFYCKTWVEIITLQSIAPSFMSHLARAHRNTEETRRCNVHIHQVTNGCFIRHIWFVSAISIAVLNVRLDRSVEMYAFVLAGISFFFNQRQADSLTYRLTLE